MRRILPFIKPPDFAARTGVTVFPPLGYSAIAEAVNSAATINHLGLLDCFLAVISKALSVQVHTHPPTVCSIICIHNTPGEG